jgi:hypothetical protein
MYKELVAQSYKGSPRAMYSYLATVSSPQSALCKSLPSQQRKSRSTPPSPALREHVAAQRAAWLFVCQPDDLDEASCEEPALLRQASPGDIFLEPWLQEANACHLPECTFAWRNGPAGGHMNRLTLIKRSMYDSVGE